MTTPLENGFRPRFTRSQDQLAPEKPACIDGRQHSTRSAAGDPVPHLRRSAIVQNVRGGPVSRILSTPDRDPGLDDHSSAPLVTKGGQAANPGLSGVGIPAGGIARLSPTDRPPREAPIWHCSGWGLPCRSCYQSRGGLLPHRFTVTTLLPKADPRGRGSLFSVALSLGLPPPGVTRHPCQRESGLSSIPDLIRDRGHPALRAPWSYARPTPASTGKRRARSAASARSVASRGPVAQGRKRRRKAASRVSGGKSG